MATSTRTAWPSRPPRAATSSSTPQGVPCSPSRRVAGREQLRRVRATVRGRHREGRALQERLPSPRSASTRSCGRRGPARLGSHVAEVELHDPRVLGRRRRHRGTAPARRQYASTEPTCAVGATGQAQVAQASARRPGRSRRSRRTRGTCSRWWRGRPAADPTSPGPKYSTNFPTTPSRAEASVSVSTRSVAVAPSGERAGEPHADDLRGSA